jgi:hypothetical protein
VKKQQRQTPKGSSLYRYLLVIAAISAGLWVGRSRSGPDLLPHIHSIFPHASTIDSSNTIHTARTENGEILGWAAEGSASGFGGPLVVVVGIETSGQMAGASVVQHKETPMFFQLAKAPAYFRSLEDRGFETIDFENGIDAVTGATLTTNALASGVKNAVSTIAADRFDVYMPEPERPFEFGFFELAILLLFAAGIGSQYLGNKSRELVRWSTQAAALLIVGFWENSPITLAKITALLSGFFPDIRSNLSLYLLLAGMVLTVLFLGKDIYCLHVCPFGAAQRFINIIGGKRTAIPLWSVKALTHSRDAIVLIAIVAALAAAQPARASYEPFAALFSLKGTTLQWFLLLIMMITSLFIRRPWCHFFCPLRACGRALLDIRHKTMNLGKAGKRV